MNGNIHNRNQRLRSWDQPDIDDLRESPALYIADILAVEADIVAHKEFKKLDVNTNLDFCGVLN